VDPPFEPGEALASGGATTDAAPTSPPELWIEPASFAERIELVGVDPRWGEELGGRLGDHPPFRPEDVEAVEALRQDLEALSFVARVSLLPASDEGPGFALSLRVPVACVPVGSDFQAVDAEGVLLSGLWPTPPRMDGAPLPVLGPLRDARGVFRNARAGDWLAETAHTDALDVALSLREHLSLAERGALGRVVIDASRARVASVDEPGVRLELEGRRLILFGRAPATDEPGELAVGEKWRSVRRALAVVDRADWELVDVRWDRPEMVARARPAREGPEDDRRIALATPPAGSVRPPAVR